MRAPGVLCVAAVLLVFRLGVAAAEDENRAQALRHAQNAFAAAQRGDWGVARDGLRKAVAAAEKSDADQRTMAVLYYEYGRALGVTCRYGEARTYLEKALAFDEVMGGPVYMSHVELARLNRAGRSLQEAQWHYRTVKPMLVAQNVPDVDPIGYADLLDEYADVLERIGRQGEAGALRSQSRKLRAAHPGRTSRVSATPYGTHCD